MTRQLDEHDYQQLSAWAARGLRLDDAAARWGISRRSLRRVFESDERAERAWALGRAELAEELVSLLLAKARNGDTVSIIYATKCLLGFRDQGPPDGEEGRSLVTINLPGALPPDAYAKLIELKPLAVAPVVEGAGDA